MKPIELTNEHKSKLLEMCIKLFPEYPRIEISDYQIDIDRNHLNPIFVDLYKGELKVPYNIYSIHWFEFCMTHLSNKITDRLIKEKKIEIGSSDYPWRIKQLLSAFYAVNYHPIDYLYSDFKKLKI